MFPYLNCNLLHVSLLVGDEDKEDDEADNGNDHHDNAAEQASVGMAAVHAVLLMPERDLNRFMCEAKTAVPQIKPLLASLQSTLYF
jgi:hypothetical protein